ncbi:hypothetical protein EE612_050571 [Oryza sativa]|nr:hypothetical protein EE612_050571 [Oryza sativa]
MALTAPAGWIRRWLWHRRLPLANPAEAVAVLFLAGGFGGGFFQWVDPAVLYPLVLTLRAQACPVAVASALPRADLAEVVAAAFLMGRSSGPPHTPLCPKLLPRIRRRRRRLLPWIRWRQRRWRRRRWWHPPAIQPRESA